MLPKVMPKWLQSVDMLVGVPVVVVFAHLGDSEKFKGSKENNWVP